jgi:MraZ protein
MEQMFLGEFEHTLDDKGRLSIPAKFRPKLAAGMVVTTVVDPCLWVFTLDRWQALAEKVSALPLTNPQAREFRRQVFGGATDLEPDRQGRVSLPLTLREYAHIDKQVVVVGLYDHLEIWNAEMWRERKQRSHADPEGRAEQFASLGI